VPLVGVVADGQAGVLARQGPGHQQVLNGRPRWCQPSAGPHPLAQVASPQQYRAIAPAALLARNRSAAARACRPERGVEGGIAGDDDALRLNAGLTRLVAGVSTAPRCGRHTCC
jgi:hypothetical protein